MQFILLRNINDSNVISRNAKLSEVIKKGEALQDEGMERELIVCKEIDNIAAHKKDWKEPYHKRELVCNLPIL